ncbi:MAG: hypothetical protein IKU26_09155, partial [Clostridia bacterium]|nr:hypothetical protein [Clostridia bacterium]
IWLRSWSDNYEFNNLDLIIEYYKGASFGMGWYDSSKASVYPALWISKDALLGVDNEKPAASTSTPTPTPSVYIGNTVTFGWYEQDGDYSNGLEEIEWVVLDKQDGKALVISKNRLTRRQYHSKKVATTWESCSLRTWLNTTFYNAAFSANKQADILTTTLKNSSDSFGLSGGNDTMDKIFLLSYDEAYRYFGSNANMNSYGICGYDWWLRSPGCSENSCYVDEHGDLVYGASVGAEKTVLPALWITIESLLEEDNEQPVETLPTPSVKIGDTVALGSYEQDNNTANGKESIEWIVIDQKDGKSLLLSKYALDAQKFENGKYDQHDHIPWSSSSIRQWLNGTFYDSAFSKEEKSNVVLTEIETMLGREHEYTKDYVFLLDSGYSCPYDLRKATATVYAQNQNPDATSVSWWLRTRGDSWGTEQYVSSSGETCVGADADTLLFVRPAIWVTI